MRRCTPFVLEAFRVASIKADFSSPAQRRIPENAGKLLKRKIPANSGSFVGRMKKLPHFP
jgi:hypothetical protein